MKPLYGIYIKIWTYIDFLAVKLLNENQKYNIIANLIKKWNHRFRTIRRYRYIGAIRKNLVSKFS